MKCTIFANGPFSPDARIDPKMLRHDYVIATDGGALHCHALGLTPDLVVGDMDSIPQWLLDEFRQQGVETRTYPERKDHTDLELAIDLAIERGMTDLTILAALGQRWDMSIAAVMLLTTPRFAGLRIILRDGPTDLFCLRGRQRLDLAAVPGARLSLIPLGGPALGVTLQGLEYPLADHCIPMGSTLGISNVVTRPEVSIEVREGLLLCLVEEPGPA
ncbi:thiamine diphosphokinase [Desulfoprunum benzoelyticum]|uniref:Thiamine diphosphokinase n=1 Tax=Desulfoprunum benzoelyticum TaxID=1506996 RepID=A0A840UVX6_9BACT|nr:thiamine diphosphokinase [Desulfoprunum benzoelyticum]MBB5346868.1 thiamine pyrophosphokinase [Desulfoprunum benzoelyticum]MBM9529470.1 thiamine diphosphokinase [Desulfoprunum benzoelyticum]